MNNAPKALELNKLSITQSLAGLRAKDFSATELLEAYITQINKHQDLNAYITTTFELARQKARLADENIAKGVAGKLEGIPVGIKDSFCTKDVLTTAGSKMLHNFTPSYESTVSARLVTAGTVMLGKLNCDEFAMGSSNETSYFGPVLNPWRSTARPTVPLVPGGSSGGSAASVAAFMAAAALGTDTGGSIRQPASFTGLVGVKPTYGRCSRYGIIAFASSLDQAGVISRNVQDAALVLETIMGFDNRDATSVNMPVPQLLANQPQDLRGIKVGLPINVIEQKGLSEEVIGMWKRSLELLTAQGAKVIEINLPHINYSLPTYYIIAPAEASANLARYDGVRFGLRIEKPGMSLDEMYEATRDAGFGDEVKRRIMIGTYVLSSGFIDAYYHQAQKVRRLIANDFHNAFKDVDTILLPSAPSAAFPANEPQTDVVSMYLNDIFTIPPSLAGLPTISVPSALSAAEHLPLGMQVICKPFDEVNMFNIAAALEKTINIDFTPKGY